jgi:hypothetical protein
MADPISIASYKAGHLIAMGAGAGVSSLLMRGPWHLKLLAGVCGAAFTFIGTPIFAPIALRVWTIIYQYLGIDPAELPQESIIGFAGFVLGLTGIDICRWLIERTKFGLSIARIPWPKRTTEV